MVMVMTMTRGFRTLMLQVLPDGILGFLAHKLANLTYSTCFSGIDAPGAALHVALADLRDRLGFEELIGNHKPRHLLAVEWNQAAQTELILSPSCPQCLVADVSEFWKPVS